MPEISRFYGIIITMYYLDHPPPHFHVRYNDQRAAFRIGDLALIEGRLPTRVGNLVREWAELHRGELLADWQLAEGRRPLRKIDPLE